MGRGGIVAAQPCCSAAHLSDWRAELALVPVMHMKKRYLDDNLQGAAPVMLFATKLSASVQVHALNLRF